MGPSKRAGLATLSGYTDGVHACIVTPDGRRIVSASADSKLKVRNLETGSQIASFTGESGLYTVAVSPDGRTFVAGEASERLHFPRL